VSPWLRFSAAFNNHEGKENTEDVQGKTQIAFFEIVENDALSIRLGQRRRD